MHLIGQSEESLDPYPRWLTFARPEYFCLGVRAILPAFYEFYVMTISYPEPLLYNGSGHMSLRNESDWSI